MADIRILTFNFHEPYLWLMAKTGFNFTIGVYEAEHLARKWHTHYRPIPPNMQMVAEPQWRADLEHGAYHVVIAHNETNALDIAKYSTPKILVCHNRRTFLQTAAITTPNAPELFAKLLVRLRDFFRFVFISESKRADYGVPGDVIYPGIDIEEFGGYTGEKAEILRVGNMMRARNLMFDVDLQERVCAGLPTRVAGFDPTIAGAQETRSFEDLLDLYRTRRCLLHVTRQEYEDGYNLSTLEAMAAGMPVVALANATCPLTDGVDGFVAPDEAGLRSRVETLLGDLGLAQEIGRRGRETVARKFSIQAFVDNWRRVIEECAQRSAWSAGQGREQAFQSGGYYRSERREMAQYVPLTTARLLDVGCGAGDFGRFLKGQGVSHVAGVELVERAWTLAQEALDEVVLGNIEQMELPFPDASFDCITFNDVLEHLVNPEAALRKAARCLAPDGVVLMSLPNVRFFQVIQMLGEGRWSYADAGILDRTHLRFFTANEIPELIAAAGLELLELAPLSSVPTDQLPRDAHGNIKLGRVTITPLDENDCRELGTYQYLVMAGKKGGDRLAKARALFDAGRYRQAYLAALEARGVDRLEQYRLAAKSAAAAGDPEEAERICREAAEALPDSPELAADLAIMLAGTEKDAEARPLLEKIVAGGDAPAGVRAALGAVYSRAGEFEAAFPLLMDAVNEDVEHLKALAPLAQAAEGLGRLAEIEAIIKRYADYYMGNVDVAMHYAELLVKLGRPGEARERLEMVLMFVPGHQRARELMGRIGS